VESVETELTHPFRIQTPSLVLRPFDLSDAAAAYALSIEPAALQWLPSQVFADEVAARRRILFFIEQYASSPDPRHGPHVLAVEHKRDGKLIGHVGLGEFEGDAEIGFGIAEAYQGQRLAVEAVIATCRWAFDKFGLPRILGIAVQSNEASRKVLVRAGFEYQTDRFMCAQGTDQMVSIYSLSDTKAENG